MRRLVQAAHVLRLEVQDERERRPHPGLEPLQDGISDLLGEVQASFGARPLTSPAPHDLPDIRARYESFERECGRNEDALALLAQLDEMVDASNSLAAAAGLESADEDASAAD